MVPWRDRLQFWAYRRYYPCLRVDQLEADLALRGTMAGSMMPSLADVRREVDRLARIIEAPADVLPTYGHSEDGARPHVEGVGSLLYYVVVERGQERERVGFHDLRPLLERIFRDVAFEMAVAYECGHRRESEDFRRQMFAKQLEYLAALDQAWADREHRRIDEILRSHPFSDGLSPRDRLT